MTHTLNVRVNYTGQWVQGEREGNGTTSFRDGAVYTGEYRWVSDTVKHPHRSSSIPGLDWSTAEASSVIPMGTALTRSLWLGRSWVTESSSESKLILVMFELQFRYASGDQREGFFRDNILDGQVMKWL